MALRGRVPSTNPRHRVPSVHEWTVVPDEPYDGPSPDLPSRGGGRKWHPEALAWWSSIRAMPHCRVWTDGDWRFAIETAVLVQAFWTGEVKIAGELRMRCAKLGLTHDDRLKLRIRYADPDSETTGDGERSGVDPETAARWEARKRRLLAETSDD